MKTTLKNRYTLLVLLAAAAFGFTSCTEEKADHTDHAAAQTVCPVSGEELGSMGEPVVMNHDGKEVKLCCDSCIEKFEADPAKYTAKVHH